MSYIANECVVCHSQVCTEGRLILEFTFDDLMRIKTWHFTIRQYRELVPRSILAMHVSNIISILSSFFLYSLHFTQQENPVLSEKRLIITTPRTISSNYWVFLSTIWMHNLFFCLLCFQACKSSVFFPCLNWVPLRNDFGFLQLYQLSIRYFYTCSEKWEQFPILIRTMWLEVMNLYSGAVGHS